MILIAKTETVEVAELFSIDMDFGWCDTTSRDFGLTSKILLSFWVSRKSLRFEIASSPERWVGKV